MKYNFGDKVHPFLQGRPLPYIGTVYKVFAKKCFVKWPNNFVLLYKDQSWADSELTYAVDHNDILKGLL